MIHHGDHVRWAQNYEAGADQEGQGHHLIEIFLHTADIGNPYMPPDISARWSAFLFEEFTQQVQDERRLGLPITQFMDSLTESISCAKSQLGFIDFVVKPLLIPLFDIFPELKEPKAYLQQNRQVVDVVEGRRRALTDTDDIAS